MRGKNSDVKVVLSFVAMLVSLMAASPLWAAGPLELSGVVYYNHNAISDYTHITPALWIYDSTHSQEVTDAVLTYNANTGAYTISNLPTAKLSVSLFFNISDTSELLPGSFHAEGFPDLTQLTAEQRNAFDLAAEYLIHMTSPWDNNLSEFATDTYLVHPCHITFHWAAVSEADHYSLNITKTRDSEHPSGYGDVETVLNTTTAETSYSVNLDGSANLEHYEFTIYAYNDLDEEIAFYMTHYTNGGGWDYRFKTSDNGGVELSGPIHYNGQLIATDVTPNFYSIYDETASQSIDNVTTAYDSAGRTYTIGNLPAHSIRISGYIYVTGTTYTLPGNYWISNFIDLAALTPAELADYPLDATEIIHMTSPWDNNGVEFPIPSAGTYPMHPRHIEFHWDAVDGADHYTVSVQRYRDGEHPSGYGYIDTPVNTTTTETSWSGDLPDSAELEHYQFYITAYNVGEETIGIFRVTYTNGHGGDYRFKTLGEGLILKKMTVKSGKTDGRDSFAVSGWLDGVNPADFVNGDTITIQLGDLTPWTITEPLKQSGNRPKYSFKGTPGVTPNLNFDLDKATFTISGKNMDLDSLEAPVFISIALGDYTGWVLAQDEGDDDVVNGRKPIPIQFLAGFEDALRVDKVVCKEDGDGHIQKLIVQGGIAMADDIDLSLVTGTIYWGNQTFNIPLGGLQAKGAGKFAYIQKTPPNSANISFDLSKCTFKIILTNTTMTWQDSPATLRIVMGTFDAEDDAVF